MQTNEQIPHTLDQAVLEIAAILARGYLHYEKSRHLAAESGNQGANAKQAKDSELLQRKVLIVRAGRAFMRSQVNAPIMTTARLDRLRGKNQVWRLRMETTVFQQIKAAMQKALTAGIIL